MNRRHPGIGAWYGVREDGRVVKAKQTEMGGVRNEIRQLARVSRAAQCKESMEHLTATGRD